LKAGALMLPPIVDSHHHFMPRAIIEDVEAFLPDAGLEVKRAGEITHIFKEGARQSSLDPNYLSDAEHQLRDMDAAGVRTAVLSAAVYQEWMTMRAATVFNRELGALQRQYPERFVGLAHVPPFGEEGALDELERAVRDDSLRGVCITTSFRGKYPDEPEYWPFYKKVDELRIPVFVHAAGCPLDMSNLSRYGLGSTLGRGLDHALVTARILYSGVLETFPNVRFLMGHLGGAFYGMVKRLIVEAPSRAINRIPARDYRAQLRRIWFDTAPSFWQGPHEVTCAIGTLGVDRICFGSDYPAGITSATVMSDGVDIMRALSLNDADLAKICAGNAKELFDL
jgi:predicted TIM-barrel fold metal-dependent hydrolase